jgi:hypothetical protein
VAFEAQRAREQLLIDRGEQYQRAIQLYFRKLRRFPASLEQLEDTNNFRFLRRRYRDPLTGKDEWRLIHIGPGGMLTDSRTQTPAGLKKDEKGGASESESAKAASGGQELPSAAVRRRASEMGGLTPATALPEGATEPAEQVPAGQETQVAGVPAPGYPPVQPGEPYPQAPTPPPEPNPEPQVGVPYVVPGPQAGQPGSYPPQPGQQPAYQFPVVAPSQPGYYPPQPGQQPAYQFPVVIPGQPYQPSQPGQPITYPQGQVIQPSSPIRVFTGQPGQSSPVQIIPGFAAPYGRPGSFVPTIPLQRPPASSQTGGESPTPYYAAQPGREQAPASGPSNPALEMIRKILTTPRPGGLGQTQTGEALTFGTGIAGVASKAEGDSIITYNERTRYDEWEFIYDLRKDRTMVAPVGPTGSPPGLLLRTPQGSSTLAPYPPPPGPGRRGR